jgi:hypothetical protein
VDPFRDAVEEVMRRIGDVEVARAEAAGERPRSCVLSPDGERLRFIVPHGYEDAVEPLIKAFGDKLIVEFDDGWFGYAPLTTTDLP